MRAGARGARNQLIKDVMRDYDYLEHMGMGVPRKIIAGMHAHNGTDPDFVVGEESLTVRAVARHIAHRRRRAVAPDPAGPAEP